MRKEEREEKKTYPRVVSAASPHTAHHSSPLLAKRVILQHPLPTPPPTPPPPPTEAININTLRMSPPTHLLLDRTNDKELYEYTHISAMLGQQCGTTHVAPHFRCTAHNAGGGACYLSTPLTQDAGGLRAWGIYLYSMHKYLELSERELY